MAIILSNIRISFISHKLEKKFLNYFKMLRKSTLTQYEYLQFYVKHRVYILSKRNHLRPDSCQ